MEQKERSGSTIPEFFQSPLMIPAPTEIKCFYPFKTRIKSEQRDLPERMTDVGMCMSPGIEMNSAESDRVGGDDPMTSIRGDEEVRLSYITCTGKSRHAR